LFSLKAFIFSGLQWIAHQMSDCAGKKLPAFARANTSGISFPDLDPSPRFALVCALSPSYRPKPESPTVMLHTLSATLVLSLLAGPAFAQGCNIDLAAVEENIARLEHSYGFMLSDIGCDAPTIPAHQLMCNAAETPNAPLWRMGRLDDLAWAYAYENATKTQVDLANPPRDDSFIAARDACTDEACLCETLIQHTNDSLGGPSPYPQ
jgi:hypothetical protein